MGHRVFIVGCWVNAGHILPDALHRSGFIAASGSYDELKTLKTIPECLVVYLNPGDCEKARECLEIPRFQACRRVLMIDPRDEESRRLVSEVRVDEVQFRPVRIRRFVARIQKLCARIVHPDARELTLCDMRDFDTYTRALIEQHASGILSLKNTALTAQLYFVQGHLRGICAGNKTKELAVLSLWRIFPASWHFEKTTTPPPWGEKNIDYNFDQILNLAGKTGDFFSENFGDFDVLQNRYRMNHIAPLESSRLPEKVCTLLKCFDGTRSIEDILNHIVIDEYLLLQIIHQLLAENLLIEVKARRQNSTTCESRKNRGTQQANPSDFTIPGYVPGQPLPPQAANLFVLEDPEEYEKFDRETIERHLEREGNVIATAETIVRKDVVYSADYLRHEAIRDEEAALALQAEDEALLNLSIDESDVEAFIPNREIDSDDPLPPSTIYYATTHVEFEPWDSVTVSTEVATPPQTPHDVPHENSRGIKYALRILIVALLVAILFCVYVLVESRTPEPPTGPARIESVPPSP